MVLTLRSISKTYMNGVQALKGINWMILLGLCVLLGTNGEIKYELLHLLSVLQQPDEGQILFEDIDVVAELSQLLQFILDTMF